MESVTSIFLLKNLATLTQSPSLLPSFDSPRKQRLLLALAAHNEKPAHQVLVFHYVRPGRIELPSRPWQGRVLPLNDGRKTNVEKYSRLCGEFKRGMKDGLNCFFVVTDNFLAVARKFPRPRLGIFLCLEKYTCALHQYKKTSMIIEVFLYWCTCQDSNLERRFRRPL